jgi:hypothetical protein
VISTNVSFDGVVQDPDGKEGFRLGGWFGQFGGKDLEEWAKVSLEEALDTEAQRLFGESGDKKPMRLVDTKTIGDGLAFLTYEMVRDA